MCSSISPYAGWWVRCAGSAASSLRNGRSSARPAWIDCVLNSRRIGWVTADLTNIDLSELNVSYGISSVDLKLPVPSGTVPLRVTGGASAVTIQHPAGVPVRVRFTGWAPTVKFDGEKLG